MNKKENLIYINHIIDAINDIEEYTKGMKKEDFLKDKKTQDAVIRNITVLGEAAVLVDDEFERLHKDIPWADIKGTRNKIVHGYFSIDLNIVWEIIIKDLPELKKKMEEVRK